MSAGAARSVFSKRMPRHGGHARRIMRSYEKRFGDSPELAVLHLIGMFDRPAKRELIDVLRRPPSIEGLNDKLVDQKEPRLEAHARAPATRQAAVRGHARRDRRASVGAGAFRGAAEDGKAGGVAGGARAAVRASAGQRQAAARHPRRDGAAVPGDASRLPGRAASGGAGRGLLAADRRRGTSSTAPRSSARSARIWRRSRACSIRRGTGRSRR